MAGNDALTGFTNGNGNNGISDGLITWAFTNEAGLGVDTKVCG